MNHTKYAQKITTLFVEWFQWFKQVPKACINWNYTQQARRICRRYLNKWKRLFSSSHVSNWKKDFADFDSFSLLLTMVIDVLFFEGLVFWKQLSQMPKTKKSHIDINKNLQSLFNLTFKETNFKKDILKGMTFYIKIWVRYVL